MFVAHNFTHQRNTNLTNLVESRIRSFSMPLYQTAEMVTHMIGYVTKGEMVSGFRGRCSFHRPNPVSVD